MVRPAAAALAICLFLQSVLFASPAKPTPSCSEWKPPKVELVRGAVVDATGKPISEATVILRDAAGKTIAEAKADANGRFQFEPVKYGNYELEVSAEGWRAYRFRIVVSRWRSKSTGIVITLSIGEIECLPWSWTRTMPELPKQKAN